MVNLSISAQLVATLKATGVDFFVSVPCKLLAGQIRLLEQDTEVCYLPVTREEEGFGLCAGASLGARMPCILMQDSGLGNSINALKSLIQFFQLPVVMLMSYRGSPGEPVPAQVPMGLLAPDGDSAGKPVGTVWIAWQWEGKTLSRCFCFNGEREAVRLAAVIAALEGTLTLVD